MLQKRNCYVEAIITIIGVVVVVVVVVIVFVVILLLSSTSVVRASVRVCVGGGLCACVVLAGGQHKQTVAIRSRTRQFNIPSFPC